MMSAPRRTETHRDAPRRAEVDPQLPARGTASSCGPVPVPNLLSANVSAMRFPLR
jgi:hypothetical protein